MESSSTKGESVSKEYTLGILVRDIQYQGPVGDIGDPKSYPFAVRLKDGEEPSLNTICAGRRQHSLYAQAAKELELEGVNMITTTCGFLVIF